MRMKKALKILERRRHWLQQRAAMNSSEGQRTHDLAEISALNVAISVLRMQELDRHHTLSSALTFFERTDPREEEIQER